MTRTILTSIAAAALASSEGSALNRTDSPERQIRALLHRWQQAFEKHDPAGAMSVYLPGQRVMVYDLSSTEHGYDALKQDYAAFFERFKGPVHSELRDLEIVAGKDVAFSHYLQGVSGTLTNGTKVHRWIRVTQGYRLVNGRWFVVHDHVSVPLDTKTGQGQLDFTP